MRRRAAKLRWVWTPTDPASKDDVVTGTMYLPVNREMDLILRAQDVIHSFFIPSMRFKQDAVPGLTIHMHFTPTETGDYEIACAELCGLGHYKMHGIAESRQPGRIRQMDGDTGGGEAITWRPRFAARDRTRTQPRKASSANTFSASITKSSAFSITSWRWPPCLSECSFRC